jgi:uncharacterized protein DUF3307
VITGDQLLCHAIGDYILQSHWMANNKTKSSKVALYHVLTYALPFLFLRPSLLAMLVIIGTHFLIDRFRLARFIVAFKNLFFTTPAEYERLSSEAARILNRQIDMATGFPADCPPWLAVWLLIIVDNCLHVLINGLALKYL